MYYTWSHQHHHCLYLQRLGAYCQTPTMLWQFVTALPASMLWIHDKCCLLYLVSGDCWGPIQTKIMLWSMDRKQSLDMMLCCISSKKTTMWKLAKFDGYAISKQKILPYDSMLSNVTQVVTLVILGYHGAFWLILGCRHWVSSKDSATAVNTNVCRHYCTQHDPLMTQTWMPPLYYGCATNSRDGQTRPNLANKVYRQ